MSAEEIWTMRDGTRIAVGNMSENHAKNALRMIIRQRREALLQIMDADWNDPTECYEAGRDQYGSLS